MGTKKILLCDDCALQRKIARACLAKRGDYQIFEAIDGDIGFKLYKLHKPHLVITDLWMPYMSGEDLAEAIRADDKQTPIMLVTGSPDDVKRRKLFNVVMQKPVAFGEIYEALDKIGI